MLKDAIAQAKNGGTCIVGAANSQHAKTLVEAVRKMIRRTKRLPEFRGLSPVLGVGQGMITFCTIDQFNAFDPETMRVIGTEGMILFIDHHAIETKYARLLEMLHRWDA
jgi:hypothetical protein